MKMHLTKIPSIVRRLHLPDEIEVDISIAPEEGAVLVAETLADEGRNRLFEFESGRLGELVEGDILPVVLGKRKALREYSGDIPDRLDVGDLLYLLCESGVVGEIRGLDETYGSPLQVRILGSLMIDGKPANIRDNAIRPQTFLEHSAPIIGVVGTCMSSGKTTAIGKLIRHFRQQGLKVAYTKLSGVASRHDPDQMSDIGASPALSFMDGGLPSTCGHAETVVEVALGVLHEINQQGPDLIVCEFGDSLLGEYHVEHLLRHPDIIRHTCCFLLATSDFVGAWGARELLRQYGIEITAITGSVANNYTGVLFIEKRLHIPTESNRYEMSKTIRLVEERVKHAQEEALLPEIGLA